MEAATEGASRPLIVDASMMRALLDGRQTQIRLLAASTWSACRVGDWLWTREAGVPGRRDPATGQECSTAMRHAQFVAFTDGWRQHKDGGGYRGAKPSLDTLTWTPAIHMPRWAARARLEIVGVGQQSLQDIDRAGASATGLLAIGLGVAWRWPKPVCGLWLNPLRAFAVRWDVTHGTQGERWDDNPALIVLTVRCEPLVGKAS